MGEFMHRMAEELRINEKRLEDHWAGRSALTPDERNSLEKLRTEVRAQRSDIQKALYKGEKRAKRRIHIIEEEARHLAKRVELFFERFD